MTKAELIARLEAAMGPDEALDLALAEWAYENRIPIASYGGPINYDPRLWIERHGWEPTASIDAALTLKRPGDILFSLTECNVDGLCAAQLGGTDEIPYFGAANTLPNAIVIAALKAGDA